ncbi:MAG: PfkB family carbohydrate kinase, partial [Calditrichota bacterium]
MSISTVDVIGIGHCCMDYLCMLDPYPEKGLKGNVKESLVIDGGPVPTALKTVVKFGGSARFCGKVGADPDGFKLAEGLRAFGVRADTLIVDPGVQTARAYIWIDPRDGSRTVALDISRFEWFSAEQVNEEWFDHCRILLTDGRAAEASLRSLTLARQRGIIT